MKPGDYMLVEDTHPLSNANYPGQGITAVENDNLFHNIEVEQHVNDSPNKAAHCFPLA